MKRLISKYVTSRRSEGTEETIFHDKITKKNVSYFLMQAKHPRFRFKAQKEVKEQKKGMEMKPVDGIQILKMENLEKVQSNSKQTVVPLAWE